MSQQPERRPDPAELSDEELLARIARLDAEQYPLAEHAERALRGDRQGGSS